MSKIDLKSKTKTELLKVAQRLGLRGISTMNKDELVDSISRAQTRSLSPKRQPLAVAAVAKKVADEIKRRAVRKRDVPPPEKKPAVARVGQAVVSKKEQAASLAAAAELSAHKFDVAPAKTPPPKQV